MYSYLTFIQFHPLFYSMLIYILYLHFVILFLILLSSYSYFTLIRF